jgi:hypothetical protein
MEDNWEMIGSFGVDSGTVLIVDPCYVLDGEGKYPLSFGHNWEEFVVMNLMDDHGHLTSKQLHGEMGVVSSTGYGDGVYPVWARMDNTGTRIAELRIEFIAREKE